MSPSPILLVADDPAMRGAIAFALEIAGFDVGTYAGGEAVLAEPSLPGGACLVIDHRLPRIDAIALLRSLRARGARTPAIVITSNPTRALRHQIEEARACLIEKPLLGDALAMAIRATAGQAEAAAALSRTN